jgi:hypothetical protein
MAWKNTQAWTNTLAYYGIRKLRIHNVFTGPWSFSRQAQHGTRILSTILKCNTALKTIEHNDTQHKELV